MKRTEHPQPSSIRDIDADYIASYRQQFTAALKAGHRAHAVRIAAALAEYGVRVTVPAEWTETAVQPTLDTANATPPAETTAPAAPETATRPAAKRAKPKPKAADSGTSTQS